MAVRFGSFFQSFGTVSPQRTYQLFFASLGLSCRATYDGYAGTTETAGHRRCALAADALSC
jgi:hypothetical protein